MPDRERVIVIGAGGHARVVLDILARANVYEVHGLLDPRAAASTLDGVPVLGGDELLPALRADGVRLAIIAVGSTKPGRARAALFTNVRAAGFDFVNALHPASVIAPTVAVGQGIAVMAGAVINAGTRVGDNVIINSGAIVEHDCVIGAHAQVAPGAVVCGGVHLGEGAHVGAGATVRQGLTVGDGALIGAGAVVLDDVPASAVVFGVPARPASASEAAS